MDDDKWRRSPFSKLYFSLQNNVMTVGQCSYGKEKIFGQVSADRRLDEIQ